MNKPGWISGLWVLTLWWISSRSLPAQTPASVRSLYTKALTYLPDSLGQAKTLADSARRMALILKTDHDSLLARCNFLLGVVHLYQSESYLSEAYLKEALQTRTAKENLQLRESCFNNLGIAYDYQDRVKEALDAYYSSLHIAEERNDSFSIAQSWINIALMERKTGNNQRGIALTKKVLDYSIRHRDSLNMGLCHQNLFIFYKYVQADTLARWHQKQALKIFQRTNNQYNRSSLLIDIATVEVERGNLQSALPYFEEAEQIALANGFEDIRLMARMGRGKALMKLPGGLDKAEQEMRASLKIITDLGRTEYREIIYQTLADIYAQKGNLEAYTRASDTLQKIRKEQFSKTAQSAYDELNLVHQLQELNQKNTIRAQQEIIYRKRVELIVLLALCTLAVFVLLFFVFQQRYKLKSLRLHQAFLEKELNEKKMALQDEDFIREIVSIDGHG